jgi:hypothetical protein
VRPAPTFRAQAGFLATFCVCHLCSSPSQKIRPYSTYAPDGAEGPARRKSNAPEPEKGKWISRKKFRFK